MLCRLKLLLVFIAACEIAIATHNRSGIISYRYLSYLTYEVTITTVTKASSTQADRDTLNLEWGDGTLEKVLRTNGPIGFYGVPQGEIVPGFDVKFNVYQSAPHTYVAPCDYIISVTDPNRISNIININNGSSVNIQFYIETELRIAGASSCSNSSPVLLAPPVSSGQAGDTLSFNAAIAATDGDSMHFELVAPKHNLEVPNYDYPHQVNAGANNVFSLNPLSGEVIWATPQTIDRDIQHRYPGQRIQERDLLWCHCFRSPDYH